MYYDIYHVNCDIDKLRKTWYIFFALGFLEKKLLYFKGYAKVKQLKNACLMKLVQNISRDEVSSVHFLFWLI